MVLSGQYFPEKISRVFAMFYLTPCNDFSGDVGGFCCNIASIFSGFVFFHCSLISCFNKVFSLRK